MSRYIDAEKIEPHEIYEDYGFVKVAYMDDINDIPTADVVPVSTLEKIKWESDRRIRELNKRIRELNAQIAGKMSWDTEEWEWVEIE